MRLTKAFPNIETLIIDNYDEYVYTWNGFALLGWYDHISGEQLSSTYTIKLKQKIWSTLRCLLIVQGCIKHSWWIFY